MLNRWLKLITRPIGPIAAVLVLVGLLFLALYLVTPHSNVSVNRRDSGGLGHFPLPSITLISPYFLRPAPLPTKIDSNFLTQVRDCFLPTAAVYGYELRITSGFRTVAEQNEVYDQGRLFNGQIVTEKPGGQSLHNFGLAVDVVDRNHGYYLNWERIGEIAAYCGLKQNPEGDMAHFEYTNGLTVAQLQAGRRPQPLKLPCAAMGQRAGAGEQLTLEDLQNCGAPGF